MKTGIASDGSFVQQEIAGVTPIVRVGFFDSGDWREDVAPLNGGGFDQAVLKATKRALGYPDDECWRLEVVDVYPGEIDLFAPCKEKYPMYSGVAINVVSPEGDILTEEYRDDTPWPNRSLWLALAFVRVLHTYYTQRGVEAKPFVPAK